MGARTPTPTPTPHPTFLPAICRTSSLLPAIFRTYILAPTVPQYLAPFSVDSNLSVVCVDWSGSFLLNGRLQEFVLTDGGQRVYRGSDTALCIPRTADKSECPAPASQSLRSFSRGPAGGGPAGVHPQHVLRSAATSRGKATAPRPSGLPPAPDALRLRSVWLQHRRR